MTMFQVDLLAKHKCLVRGTGEWDRLRRGGDLEGPTHSGGSGGDGGKGAGHGRQSGGGGDGWIGWRFRDQSTTFPPSFGRLGPSPSKLLFHLSSAPSQCSSHDSSQCSKSEPPASPPVCGTLPAGFTASKYHRLNPPHFCSPCRRFTKSPLSWATVVTSRKKTIGTQCS
jgi:hypothetical protein